MNGLCGKRQLHVEILEHLEWQRLSPPVAALGARGGNQRVEPYAVSGEAALQLRPLATQIDRDFTAGLQRADRGGRLVNGEGPARTV